MAAAIATVALGAVYQYWLRDSSLVAVKDVDVSGLTTKDGPRIRAMLESVAGEMTTLHIRVDALEDAARQFPVIAAIEVERDFPHRLRIAVTERRPAGLVSVDGVPLPVASDGTVLRGLSPPAGLPLLRMDKPASDGRVTDPRTLRALVVTGAAPGPLPQRIERVSEGPARGIVVQLEDGPEVIFGDAHQAAAKWAAAARVLADPEAAGASYVDVRLPERPVAGGLPVETIEPVAPAGEPIAPPVAPEAAVPVDPALAAPAGPAATVAPVAPEPAPAPAPTPEAGAPTSPQP
ncbi:MAG: cell division protein FtsQ [Thermoleophilaceae bacterium]|nr:cell division protein FtsQ [Thermoleophilaceae bacterium]